MIAPLSPGSYSVQVSGADGGTGEGIVEIYEITGPGAPTIGTATVAVTNLLTMVRVSDTGMDFQNKMLRSLRSAWRVLRR